MYFLNVQTTALPFNIAQSGLDEKVKFVSKMCLNPSPALPTEYKNDRMTEVCK